jgi:uncharacterized repeat protein (TIGR03806 family)
VLEPAFGNVVAEEAVAITSVAGRGGELGRWYVATKPGPILTFADASGASPDVFLDLSRQIEEAGEAGVLDIAFHPQFADNGEVFVHYNAPGGTAFLSRVSKFISRDGGLTADPASEEVILEIDQPYVNHDGGDINFGPDGYLYLALGDGGSAGDPQGHAQNLDTLLGAMLRVDVDVPGQPYGIPDDNPFVEGGGEPEIWAWGFRNPYRWNFDSKTGDLWLGDVGQHYYEEIDKVERGGNYGWKIREGTHCLSADQCETDGLIDPAAQYTNTGTASVVAGFVYRGAEIPGLDGTLVYNDFYFGTIYGLPTEGGPARVIGQDARGIAGWGESPTGELYGVSYYNGRIYRLEEAPPPPAGPDPFPRELSLTGCVDMLEPARPATGAFSYEVALPFWSDGADKERFVSLPEGERIAIGEDGDLDLPVGTVLVKSFLQDGERIETRLMVHHDDGWAGYGYAWNEAGTEARYVEQTRTEQLAGGEWTFPGSRECMACHTAAAGRTLGLEAAQLGNELVAFAERGWLDHEPQVSPLPVGETEGDLETRARAYLHVNCSGCHREEGNGGRSALDLRFDVPLADTGLCDTRPNAGRLGVADASVVMAGDPAKSVLLARMTAQGSARMPPLGTALPDPDGVALIEAWIQALGECPQPG